MGDFLLGKKVLRREYGSNQTAVEESRGPGKGNENVGGEG